MPFVQLEVLYYLCTRIKMDIPLNNLRNLRGRNLFLAIILALCSTAAHAQNGATHSSYSRFGLGLLNDQSQTWNRSMGGVGIALPSGSRLNSMNPASYAHIDSLSFILDAGMSASFGRMSTKTSSIGINNACFDYIVAGFRLHKGLGLSFGFKPYSSIGYNYTTTSPNAFRDEITGEIVRNTITYQGKGGLNEFYLGMGWQPFKHFSIGANAGILWGGYNHLMIQDFTQGGSSSNFYDGFNFLQYADVLTYKLDFGVQYAFRVSRKDWLTLGAKVGLGHQFDGNAYLYRYMSTGDTLQVDNDLGFDIPMSYSAGIAWQHKNTLLVSADAHYQQWQDCGAPQMIVSQNVVSYPTMRNIYKNRLGFNVGMEYTPDPMASKGYYKHMKYRFGVSYNTPYINIAQGEGATRTLTDGPSELGISMGVGLPLSNFINSRARIKSTVNIGVQWLRRAPSNQNLITENYFMLNLGVLFNEGWFMKFKIQ